VKIKLDENLPAQLLGALARLGHDTDTAAIEGVAGRGDHAVWLAAQRSSRFLITQDLDFSDVRKFTPGAHAGLLLVRLRAPGRTALAERIRALFDTEDVSTWSGCLVVATEHKIRVRRPPQTQDLTAGRRSR
jgi:predicted nuclease of predicted toxin-antitoxin system